MQIMVILSLLGGAHERNIRHVVNSVILYRMKRLRDETEQLKEELCLIQ